MKIISVYLHNIRTKEKFLLFSNIILKFLYSITCAKLCLEKDHLQNAKIKALFILRQLGLQAHQLIVNNTLFRTQVINYASHKIFKMLYINLLYTRHKSLKLH